MALCQAHWAGHLNCPRARLQALDRATLPLKLPEADPRSRLLTTAQVQDSAICHV